MSARTDQYTVRVIWCFKFACSANQEKKCCHFCQTHQSQETEVKLFMLKTVHDIENIKLECRSTTLRETEECNIKILSRVGSFHGMNFPPLVWEIGAISRAEQVASMKRALVVTFWTAHFSSDALKPCHAVMRQIHARFKKQEGKRSWTNQSKYFLGFDRDYKEILANIINNTGTTLE